MKELQFKIIKTPTQYREYCSMLEELVMVPKKTGPQLDAIELVTLLIETYDAEHNTFTDADPVESLKFLMKQNNIKATGLAKELSVSKSLISDILHYRRGISRDVIRKFADRFNVSQAF